MTVLEGIQKSAEFLAKKDVESARLQAELLLAHVLQLPRMKLYLNFERALTEGETSTFRDLVKRRSQREPLQHIIGSTSFCGLEISVNRHVLVPRPETEILAELGWQWLGEHRTSNIEHRTPNAPTALDFGTGSGCIAIALAAKCLNAKITALDVSAEALEVAQQNAVRNNVADRIEFIQANGLNELAARWGERTREPIQFNLIISNPPYIPTAEIETLDPEVRDYDPRSALDGGPDGLDFYRRFAVEARDFLKADGKIMLEFGDGQADSIRRIFEAQNWIVEAIREDYTQRQRILIANYNHG
ncbi:MAG TPA: peptide chain release factor N(5)-glutamine methyltransferase [Candidatus Polarisedimenticolia bacterium]|nr:peptide chain release factor N(5)-glutamine methyltransferase [Candidatus Polarisedimenticolia bacterium]